MASKEKTQAERLMTLALRSPFDEEGRSAAHAAVKLIAKHDLLSESQGLARVDPLESVALAEIRELRKEIAELRREREMPSPAKVFDGPTTEAILATLDHLKEIEALKREIARLKGAIHVVQPGESPALIAEIYTGDARRMTELVAANPSKPTIVSGGWRTFANLLVGERLRLPEGWVLPW